MINQEIFNEYKVILKAFGIDAFNEIYGGYFNYQRQRLADKKEVLK